MNQTVSNGETWFPQCMKEPLTTPSLGERPEEDLREPGSEDEPHMLCLKKSL